MAIKPIPTLIALAITLFIWFVLPVPAGVSENGWHLLALFAGTIAAIIGKALPLGAVSIIAVALVAITGVTVGADVKNPGGQAIKDALSSFSNPLIWLIVISIMVARGVIKTGLGERIGYYFIALFGKRTIGIAYALALSETVLAPITPSNTARGGGIIHPIMKSIAGAFDSDPAKGTQGKIGRYLALVNYNANPITSGMFITATAPNPLVVDAINKMVGSDFHMSWTTWAVAMFIPGMVCILLMPLVLYFIYPPEIRETPDAAVFAHKKLAALGKIKRDEWWMLGVFVLLLLFWADIPFHLTHITALKLNPTTTAFLGLSVLLISGVLSWGDVTAEKSAWDTLIWFGALVMMADWLNKLGVVTYFAGQIEGGIEALALPWFISMILLALIYLYAHYAFASTTAHISAMLLAFYGAGITLGAPPLFFGLVLAAAGNIMMSLTHYATGTAPVIFSSNYATLGEWWKAGFITSIVNFTVWIAVGMLWWKAIYGTYL